MKYDDSYLYSKYNSLDSRAMELSKGPSYTYDFEDFAAFDAKNRKNKVTSARTKALPHNTHPDIPYGEPEITVNKEF